MAKCEKPLARSKAKHPEKGPSQVSNSMAKKADKRGEKGMNAPNSKGKYK